MASVQELILAAQAGQKKPGLIAGLEGLATGVLNAQTGGLDRAAKLMAMEQARQEMAYQAQGQQDLKNRLSAQAREATEADIRQKLGGLKPPTPVVPQGKLKEVISQDEKGRISRKYETVEPKEVDPIDTAYKKARTKYYEEQAADVPEKQEERIYKQRERRNTERTRIIDRFNADASVKKAQQSIDAANTIRGLVDSGNPIAAAAIPTFMARASGEVGNLSEADKRPFGGSQAIIQRMNQAVTQAANGKLTPENAQFVRELSAIMEKRANDNIGALAKKRAKQYSAASDFLEENDIFSTLVPEMQMEPGNEAPPVAPKVGGTFNGQKILKVERID